MAVKTWLKSGALAAVTAVGFVAASAPAASAYIACNRWHQCWHAGPTRYTYPRAGIAIYPDTWRWHGRGYRWAADHPGRGYWWHGRWVTF